MSAPTAVSTKQKGVAIYIETRPQFAGYINTDFPEARKAREEGEIEGEFGQVVTRVWNDLTDEVPAKLVVTGTVATPGTLVLPEIGDTITESAVDVNTNAAVRKWSVMEVGRPRKAGKELILDVKLKRSEGCTLT